MDALNPNTLQSSLTSSAEVLWTKLVEYVPNIFGTILLLVIGYVISRLVASLSKKLLQTVGIDKISEKIGLHEGLKKIGIQLTSSDLFSKVFFWLIMLIFIISASEALHLTKITDTIDTFVRYLPNILGAGLIFIFGLMLAHFIKNLIEGYTQKVSVEYGKTLSVVIYFIMVIVVTVFAINQLQIETELLNRIIEIVLISIGVALAISLGLGTKELSRNMISGIYLKGQLQPGAHVEFNNINGNIKHFGVINTVIETSNGEKYHIPHSSFAENVIKSK